MFHSLVFCLFISACLGQVVLDDYDAIELHRGGRRDRNRNRQGSSVATVGQIPYHVLIGYGDTTLTAKFGCSGSLLKQNYVLTSAKCIKSMPVGVMWVFAGINIGINMGLDIGAAPKVVDQIYHPYFDETNGGRNDIAILKLDPPFTADIKTVTLPSRGTGKRVDNPTYYNKQRATYSGWGLTSGEVLTRAANLMVTNTNVIPHLKCRIRSNRQHQIRVTTRQICTASYENRNNDNKCYADLGSPLTARDRSGNEAQIGVASYGVGTCRDSPIIFTFIEPYVDWITSTITE